MSYVGEACKNLVILRKMGIKKCSFDLSRQGLLPKVTGYSHDFLERWWPLTKDKPVACIDCHHEKIMLSCGGGGGGRRS